MTASGYSDYLSRMTTRIAETLTGGMTRSAKQYSVNSRYPFLPAYRPLLTGWLETYIRGRLFDADVDPLDDENWRVLLIDDIACGIAGVFASALVNAATNRSIEGAEVVYRWFSDAKTISVRQSSSVDVDKSI